MGGGFSGHSGFSAMTRRRPHLPYLMSYLGQMPLFRVPSVLETSPQVAFTMLCCKQPSYLSVSPTEADLCEVETTSVSFTWHSQNLVQGAGIQEACVWLSRTNVSISLQDRKHCTWSHPDRSSASSVHQLADHL